MNTSELLVSVKGGKLLNQLIDCQVQRLLIARQIVKLVSLRQLQWPPVAMVP
jgi:hypothetical protein